MGTAWPLTGLIAYPPVNTPVFWPSAEAAARVGFDYVCIDTQHGVIDYLASASMIQAIELAGGARTAVRWKDKADLRELRARLGRGADRLSCVVGVLLPAVEEVLGVKNRLAAHADLLTTLARKNERDLAHCGAP